MKKKRLQSAAKRGLIFLLSLAVSLSGIAISPSAKRTAKAAENVEEASELSLKLD